MDKQKLCENFRPVVFGELKSDTGECHLCHFPVSH